MDTDRQGGLPPLVSKIDYPKPKFAWLVRGFSCVKRGFRGRCGEHNLLKSCK